MGGVRWQTKEKDLISSHLYSVRTVVGRVAVQKEENWYGRWNISQKVVAKPNVKQRAVHPAFVGKPIDGARKLTNS